MAGIQEMCSTPLNCGLTSGKDGPKALTVVYCELCHEQNLKTGQFEILKK